MTLGHVAIIEVVALIAVLGWAAWFVWHTRRRAAAADIDLQFDQLREAMDSLVRNGLTDHGNMVLDLMLATGADEATATAIVDIASEVSIERGESVQPLWAEVLFAATALKHS